MAFFFFSLRRWENNHSSAILVASFLSRGRSFESLIIATDLRILKGSGYNAWNEYLRPRSIKASLLFLPAQDIFCPARSCGADIKYARLGCETASCDIYLFTTIRSPILDAGFRMVGKHKTFLLKTDLGYFLRSVHPDIQACCLRDDSTEL